MKTPVFDWETGEFKIDSYNAVVLAEDTEALQQVIFKIHATNRGTCLVYADLDNPELHHKYGNDIFMVLQSGLSEEDTDSEIKRMIVEALVYDPWITGASGFNITRERAENGEMMIYVSYKVESIFDTVQVEGVQLNG